MQLTLTLPKVVAEHLREQVASGVYANESEYIESILLSETLFDPTNPDELTRWINTEGVRRLRAMEYDSSLALTGEQVFDLGDEDRETNEVR